MMPVDMRELMRGLGYFSSKHRGVFFPPEYVNVALIFSKKK